ncbi:MAG: hypothetical protein HKN03_03780 [Acidimicrobiales bacterium]|nr:hypothetical protein [Acidimicrobiales bacterium]
MSDQQPSQPPGWYHAQGDPPGTTRFWDGSQWQGGPQTAASPGYGAPQPGYAPGFGGTAFAEGSQATTALVVGILSFVCCGLLGPVAWYVGQQEINGIDAGRRDPSNRGTANAGRIIGIIATVLLVFGLGFYAIAVAISF